MLNWSVSEAIVLDTSSSIVSQGMNVNLVFAAIQEIEKIYYPILAVVGVSVNVVTIVILSRGKCGLSSSTTCYLVAMASADLLVVFLDLILRQIPIAYQLRSLKFIPVCNIHAVLLYAVTDCSVWFTVAFTFDRFIVICCQKLKSRYCTDRTAAWVLGTVAVLSTSKDTSWYFMLTAWYWRNNSPWFCYMETRIKISRFWGVIELLHNIFTPGLPFVLILLLNVLTVRDILVSSRARKRLRNESNVNSQKDPEMESRRKSIILLFAISGNFIVLWSILMTYSMWWRIFNMAMYGYMPVFVLEIGFMMQLLSCCTNTCIYAITQRNFRKQLINVVYIPLYKIVHYIKY
ncbi:probable G-protein coupled receptor 139 [Scyliorhinus canicula]|uniref:probable G-protein coupled receptor 139 n=1 Tax=Scyliorhinus canicula TaxID=7830 RepID=UPI0018F6B112|nr:probable G-protein coupled receptor 139 [Scyliorhinus canicula]